MANCPECGIELKEVQAVTSDGMVTYFKCRKCRKEYDKQEIQKIGTPWGGEVPFEKEE